MAIFKVKFKNPRTEDEAKAVRVVSAEREAQVAKYIVSDFEITRLEPEEALKLGAQGVKLEQAPE